MNTEAMNNDLLLNFSFNLHRPAGVWCNKTPSRTHQSVAFIQLRIAKISTTINEDEDEDEDWSLVDDELMLFHELPII